MPVSRIDPVERILNLLTLLHESPRPLTRAEIVERMARGSTPYPTDQAALHQMFTSDRRTITSGLGVVIHQAVRSGSDAGQTEYWVDSAEIRLPDLGLDEDERLVLAVALAAMSRTVPQAAEAEMKLGTGWQGSAALDVALEVPGPVVAMIEAARTGGVMEMVNRQSGTPVIIEPWAVVHSHGAWTVIGAPHHLSDTPVEEGSEPSMLVEPISASTVVTRLPDALRAQAPIGLDESRIDQLLVTRATEPVVARVRVEKEAVVRASLSERVISRAESDRGVDLDVRIDDLEGFRHWLLALGDRAEVVAPPEVRRHIHDWLESILATPEPEIEIPSRPSTAARRPGPEPVAQRLHRLLAIVPWLYRQRSVPVETIAERVGATPQQVVRDLTLASMCGLPPYTADALYGFWVDSDPDTGASVVHVLHPNLLVDAVRLTPRQAASVSVALSALMAMHGADTEVIERVRDKIDEALGGVEVRIRLDEPPFLEVISRAAERGERLRIQYVDLNDGITERVVDPLKVFVDRGHSYVYTDDYLRNAERVFRIDRIVSVEPTGEHFVRRDVVPPAGRNWAWMIPDREVVIALPEGCDWVVERYSTLGSLQLDDGGLLVWLSVVSDRWLSSLLLRCGPGAHILEPIDTRDSFRERVADLADRYR